MKHRVRELYSEIEETTRYLNSVEKSFDKLYQNDIEQLRLGIDYVFVDLPNVQSFAVHTFDKQYMTKLMLLCMNQIVISCINYMTENNTVVFWNEPKHLMIYKLEKCIQLNEHVFCCYNKTANKLSAEGRKPFQLSFDTSIGHFIMFIERLGKVSGL